MVKRLFDIALALLAIIVAVPLMVILAIAVAATMGRPVLFTQKRVGLGGDDFHLRKFRSMKEAFGADGKPLPDEDRITPLGRFLRRSRLDELTELWLILNGKMSFVGPRPLPRQVLEQNHALEQRSQVRPGLTGLAQVSGNTLLTNEEKFALDAFYVEIASFREDFIILCKTLNVVLRGEIRNEALIQRALKSLEASGCPGTSCGS